MPAPRRCGTPPNPARGAPPYDLRYHDADGRILNVAYRYANGVPDPISGQTSPEQIDLAAHWPINLRWRVFGR